MFDINGNYLYPFEHKPPKVFDPKPMVEKPPKEKIKNKTKKNSNVKQKL